MHSKGPFLTLTREIGLPIIDSLYLPFSFLPFLSLLFTTQHFISAHFYIKPTTVCSPGILFQDWAKGITFLLTPALYLPPSFYPFLLLSSFLPKNISSSFQLSYWRFSFIGLYDSLVGIYKNIQSTQGFFKIVHLLKLRFALPWPQNQTTCITQHLYTTGII